MLFKKLWQSYLLRGFVVVDVDLKKKKKSIFLICQNYLVGVLF